MMITTVRGRFAEFEGTIVVDEDRLAEATVEVTMKAASLDSHLELRDHFLRDDLLHVERYPSVTFRSTRISGSKEKLSVTGDLTIRDVTRPITLDVKRERMVKDAEGKTRSSFSASGKFDRKDFGLTWNAAMEMGGVLVSDVIKIEIAAQAVLVG